MDLDPRRRPSPPPPILDEWTMMRIASVENHLSCGVIDTGTMTISHDPEPKREVWDALAELFIAAPKGAKSPPTPASFPMVRSDGPGPPWLIALAKMASGICPLCTHRNKEAWTEEQARHVVQIAQQTVGKSSLHEQMSLLSADKRPTKALAELSPILAESERTRPSAACRRPTIPCAPTRPVRVDSSPESTSSSSSTLSARLTAHGQMSPPDTEAEYNFPGGDMEKHVLDIPMFSHERCPLSKEELECRSLRLPESMGGLRPARRCQGSFD